MSAARASVWPARAEALARRIPRERLEAASLAAAARSRGPWYVAFSGGADSLALLLLLWAHFPARRARLVALHFNHRLRGRAATADARFCAQVAAGLGVKYAGGEWTAAERSETAAAARTARFAFFDSEIRQGGGRILWLGHQLDDVAETMLMRLARGSGAGGLAAPRPCQPMPGGRRHLRPLLGLSKAELTSALAAARIPWREDASNAGNAHFRNRVRRFVLPAWSEAAGRDALAGAGASRALLEEDDDALNQWLDELAVLHADGSLAVDRLRRRPVALRRRALHRWLARQPGGNRLSRQGFDQLLARISREGATRFSLGVNDFAVLARGRLRFERSGFNQVRRSQ